jgi:hypothetical protein
LFGGRTGRPGFGLKGGRGLKFEGGLLFVGGLKLEGGLKLPGALAGPPGLRTAGAPHFGPTQAARLNSAPSRTDAPSDAFPGADMASAA